MEGISLLNFGIWLFTCLEDEMKYNNVSEIPPSEEGNYIILGGKGILDGLKCRPTKFEACLIIKIAEDKMTVKQYRKRITSILPYWNFDQEAITYSPKEYKKFPTYSSPL
jgi:hypothetical protein